MTILRAHGCVIRKHKRSFIVVRADGKRLEKAVYTDLSQAIQRAKQEGSCAR